VQVVVVVVEVIVVLRMGKMEKCGTSSKTDNHRRSRKRWWQYRRRLDLPWVEDAQDSNTVVVVEKKHQTQWPASSMSDPRHEQERIPGLQQAHASTTTAGTRHRPCSFLFLA
jgi:hypothetical protein